MNSRRTFIKNIGLVAGATLILPSFGFDKAYKNVGIQLYTLRDQLPKDVKGVIEQIAKAGYKEVETYGFSIESQFWGIKTAEFKKILDANGLKAVSGHFGLGSYLTDGNTDELKATIQASKILKGKYVTIPWLDSKLRKNAESYKQLAKKMNEAGKMCKAEGLKLAYHNHDFEFKKYGSTTGYEILLKETDKDLVDFELDLYWAVRSGNLPAKLFKENPGRFPMWHVKDMDKNKEDWNTEIGKGVIDFKGIFDDAKLSGMKHFFVEQETNYQPNEIDSIKTSINYIKANLI
jgi:sugar phosphate isomerase/epimerase